MNRFRVMMVLAFTAVGLLGGFQPARAGVQRLGGGLHYLRNFADIKSNPNLSWDKNSFGLMGSYQYNGGLLKGEVDGEYVFNFAGSDKPMITPSAWLLAGGLVYGGAGVGIGYLDGDWQKEPFYALRAGVDLPLGGMDLDLHGTYRFQNDSELKRLTGEDLNTVTFAALLRFDLGGSAK